MITEERAYEDLANAVIFRAVRDYQHALIKLHLNPNSREAESDRRILERFFHSEWCSTLTNMDGEVLMDIAKKQVEARGWKRFDMSD